MRGRRKDSAGARKGRGGRAQREGACGTGGGGSGLSKTLVGSGSCEWAGERQETRDKQSITRATVPPSPVCSSTTKDNKTTTPSPPSTPPPLFIPPTIIYSSNIPTLLSPRPQRCSTDVRINRLLCSRKPPVILHHSLSCPRPPASISDEALIARTTPPTPKTAAGSARPQATPRAGPGRHPTRICRVRNVRGGCGRKLHHPPHIHALAARGSRRARARCDDLTRAPPRSRVAGPNSVLLPSPNPATTAHPFQAHPARHSSSPQYFLPRGPPNPPDIPRPRPKLALSHPLPIPGYGIPTRPPATIFEFLFSSSSTASPFSARRSPSSLVLVSTMFRLPLFSPPRLSPNSRTEAPRSFCTRPPPRACLARSAPRSKHPRRPIAQERHPSCPPRTT